MLSFYRSKLDTPKISQHYNHPRDSLPQSSSLDSILSATPSSEGIDKEFKKVSMKPERLSLSTSNLSIEEDEVTTGNRRLRLRNRKTISRMLQDGANHQVWTPGVMSPTRETLQVLRYLPMYVRMQCTMKGDVIVTSYFITIGVS